MVVSRDMVVEVTEEDMVVVAEADMVMVDMEVVDMVVSKA